MKIEKKAIILAILFLIFLLSCNKSQQINKSIYGLWEDERHSGITFNIDSSTHILTIDESAVGGKKFKSKFYKINANTLESDILPDGIKIRFNNTGNMKLYPIREIYGEEIRYIYVITFTKKH